MKKIGHLTLALFVCVGILGCGGSGKRSTSTNNSSSTLTSLSVTAPNNLAAGLTMQLAASGAYSDGTSSDVTAQATWKTSDSTIASVSSSGMLTALKQGSVTVTATMGSVTGSASVTVGQPVLRSISVSGPSSVGLGATVQYTAQGVYSDQSTQPVTSQLSWHTSDSTVATITASGMLTAQKQGSVTVTATVGSIAGNLSVTVTAPVLASIRVNPSSFSIAAGQTKQLAASGVYTDGSVQDVTSQATWSSSATNVVTVSATGLATGVSQGTATITAAVGSISGTSNATVGAAVLSSITVTPSSASVAAGETQAFAANAIFSDGSQTDITSSVTWSSSATGIATVDATGLATGVASGSASITATSGTVSGSASLTVTAAKLTSIDISPDGDSIPVGGQDQLLLTGTFSDGTTQTITNATWSSSDSTLASVDPNTGLVTGVADSGGNAVTITAQAGGFTNTTTIFVTSAVAESIFITPATVSIASGTTTQFAVNGIFSDGSTQPLTSGLSWTSSAPSVAGISASGVATGSTPGQSTITATYGSMSATATLTVTAATLKAIVVTPPVPTVGINGTIQFTATCVFTDNTTQDVTSQVTWISSASSVAVISSTGLASALSNGTSIITASDQGVSGTATLTVTTATLVSIAVLPANPIVPPHTRLQMTAVGTFSDGTTVQLTGVTWYTNTGRYASVSGSGVVRTKRSTAQAVPVYAKLNGIVGQTSLTITSMSVTSLQLAPVNPSIATGTTEQFQLIGLFSDGVTTVDLTKSARWQTSDFSAAVINRSGLATGMAAGSVTITGSYGGLTPATTTLTVSNATLQSITVAPAAQTVIIGGLQPFTATGSFSDGSTQDLTLVCTWTSSTPTVAVVNQIGVATSVTQGTTNITATFHGVSGSGALTVN
ncbi:MAG TPA: Ig-like domain-containing protein [Acidobacteriaceae bacterium]|nr:Ig-like domain-containing protein [Acidobacteriaceae bacterium]